MSEAQDQTPADPIGAFAYLVSKCASGLLLELVDAGRTETEARNIIIHCFLDFAAGEACRQARRAGRGPDREKWGKAVGSALDRAAARTPFTQQSEGK